MDPVGPPQDSHIPIPTHPLSHPKSRCGVVERVGERDHGKGDAGRYDGHTLGVDGAHVGVLEQRREVCLGRLLERHDSVGMEAEIGLEVLRDLANQTLERKLADEKPSALLIPSDLTKSDSADPVRTGINYCMHRIIA